MLLVLKAQDADRPTRHGDMTAAQHREQYLLFFEHMALQRLLHIAQVIGQTAGALRPVAVHLLDPTRQANKLGQLLTVAGVEALEQMIDEFVRGRFTPVIMRARINAEQRQTVDHRLRVYHRLSVYPVRIPPLRERGADILLLAGHFIEQNRTRLGVRSFRLSPQGEQALLNYSWPGNVRELEHVISRAALKALGRAESRQAIVTLEIEPLEVSDPARVLDSGVTAVSPAAALRPLKQALEACQRH